MRSVARLSGAVWLCVVLGGVSGTSAATTSKSVFLVASETCGRSSETLVTATSGACETQDLLFRVSLVPAGTADSLYIPLTGTHQRTKIRNFVGSCYFPIDYANQTAGGVEYQGFASNQAFARPKAPEKAMWTVYVSLSARGRAKSVRSDLEGLLSDFDRRLQTQKLGALDLAGNSYCQKSSS